MRPRGTCSSFGAPSPAARVALTVCLACVACAACVATGAAGAGRVSGEPDLVLEDVTLIDGTGAPPVPHRTIAVRHGRIVGIYRTGARVSPQRAVIHRLPGHFVLPGFVDAHVHATMPFTTRARQDQILGLLFRGGVTTVRDMAGDAVVLAERARESSAPDARFPRLYYSALMAGPSWVAVDNRVAPIAHGLTPGQAPWLRAVTDTSDLRAIVADAKRTGATGLKIYADVPPALVGALSAEAHRAGLRVWSHAAIIPTRPSEAVRAGVDVLSHVMSIVLEGVDTMPSREGTSARLHDYAAVPATGPAITRLLEEMRARGTVLEPTLYATRLRANRAAAAVDDSTQRRWVPLAAWGYAITRRAHEMGVPILAGTDLMGDTLVDSLPFLHVEMELLVREAGLRPLEAITAATMRGAAAVGASDSLGTIAVGKVADLVVLAADPTLDIRNTRAITHVIKGGLVHPRGAASPSRGR
jgi:imidazolonepropionase-like amidohydrolase